MNKRTTFALLLSAVVICVLGISINAQYAANSREAIAEKVKDASTQNDISSAKALVETLEKDPFAGRDDKVFDAIMTLYPKIDTFKAQQKDVVLVKKSLIDRVSSSRRPEAAAFLTQVYKKDKNPEVRKYAQDSLAYLSGQPLNERIDVSKYTVVDGVTMTYEKAYPILIKQLNASDLKQRAEAARNLASFGNRLKGDDVIEQMISLYKATPSPPTGVEPRSLTEEQRNQIRLKTEILTAVAASGDSRRDDLLHDAETDASPFIRDTVKDVKKWTVEVGEWLPGGIPLKEWKPSEKPSQKKVYFLGKYLTNQGAISEATKVFSGSDIPSIKKAVGYFRRRPQDVRGTKLFDAMVKQFNSIDRLSKTGNDLDSVKRRDDILLIKEGILIVLSYSGDNRAEGFLKSVQKNRDSSLREVATDLLKDAK